MGQLRSVVLAGGGTGTDGYINPTVFKQVFCADVPNATRSAATAVGTSPAAWP